MRSLFSGENLVLEYDERGGNPRLYLGSARDQWYFLDKEKAMQLRAALDEGIQRMEANENNNRR